ncbi:MAG: hypothetical protein ACPGGG_08185 [Parvibaculales bacterium]
MKFFVAVSLYIAVIGLTAWSADRNSAADNSRTLFINLTAATDNGQ